MTTAILGVHASDEVEIRTRYPSIAATGPGRVLGTIFDLIPVKIWGIKISHLLFVLPLAPLGVLIYILQKIGGERYVLTNRSMQRWSSLGSRQYQSVPLTDIAEIEYSQQPGQAFYHAGNLTLIGRKDEILMQLNGIKDAEVFQKTIVEVREARLETETSLATIAARA